MGDPAGCGTERVDLVPGAASSRPSPPHPRDPGVDVWSVGRASASPCVCPLDDTGFSCVSFFLVISGLGALETSGVGGRGPIALCRALTLLRRAGAPGLAALCLSFPLSNVRVTAEGQRVRVCSQRVPAGQAAPQPQCTPVGHPPPWRRGGCGTIIGTGFAPNPHLAAVSAGHLQGWLRRMGFGGKTCSSPQTPSPLRRGPPAGLRRLPKAGRRGGAAGSPESAGLRPEAGLAAAAGANWRV